MQGEELKHLANLVRIEMSEQELEAFKGDFDSILDYVSQIQSVSAEAADARGDALIVVREDSDPHKSGIYTEALLGEAPERKGDYIKVKKIL